ncbi:PhoX family phosphatase [Luteipulveratus sp. YIM 133296]|uniref:PhoX family phosphatase n=2 Tax=Luteipulveratus flavus TaxID=3031728 RepID=A0ABT6C6N2_9MICO|nr:PhoX family phosphatase [Luteipulveratus sp. YIM 133296]MDF8264547.1 PhoX family phosphatase [Luteipulveratus sp. YIM 133296]
MTCHYRCDDACAKPVPNTSENTYFGDIVRAGISRRTALKASGVTAAFAGLYAVAGTSPAAASGPTGKPGARSPYVHDFEATAPQPFATDAVVTPEGFTWSPVVRWGDPIVAGAPAFDFDHQSAAAQEKQFGYNCDYVGLVRKGSHDKGLLVVNNEYTNEELMFRGYTGAASLTTEQIKIVMAAHGMSVVEVHKNGREWKARMGSSANRRVTATTPFELVGPAAGSPLLRTKADPTGRRVLGTFGNCAGGTTPWGTVLSGEENFNGYFKVDAAPAGQEDAFKRYGLTGSKGRAWEKVDPRFDGAVEANEPNRFGYIVELDPTDPTSTPRKLTALGRLKHEGATVSIAPDRRVVAVMGDDERFDYMYKFVSKAKYREGDRRHNLTLLEEGDLYVARFTGDGFQDGVSDGTGEWLPLIVGGVSKVAGMSVEQVLVHTRLAADKVGPTKMDRPEDVELNPVNGRVYAALTNNSNRQPSQIDEANPRASNKHGQVIEITATGGDHTTTTFTWKLVLICGDPKDPSTYFDGFDRTQVSPISCPDNLAFDSRGNLWISTDGNALGNADAFFMMPLEGPERGHLQQFHTVPYGAESAGPLIVDDTTVLCSVQHPGEVTGASPDKPVSRFPYDGTGQPRPSVIQVFVDKPGRGHGRD